eukprot:jgi/Galph1/5254/GphlegSOOS_G3849.1
MERFIDRVKKSSLTVKEQAEDVFVSEEAVSKLSKKIYNELCSRRITVHDLWKECELNPLPDKLSFGLSSVRDICSWIFWIDCINFCFWPQFGEKWTVFYHGKYYTGYFALCAALNHALETKGKQILSAEFLKDITEIQLAELLMPAGFSRGTVPLLSERTNCLRAAGRILTERFDSHVFNLLRCCHNSLDELVRLLVENFPSFRDEAFYHENKVFFYKRAQIFAADIFACLNQKVFVFTDPNCLTMFADYRVAQVLRHSKVLQYSERLQDKINHGTQLPSASREEVELRACSIVAVEMIRQQIQQWNPNLVVSSQLIDYLLWNEAMAMKECGELDQIPFHKVITIFY